MPSTFNYAEKWRDELIDIVIQGTLSSPFILADKDAVTWEGAKTFHFTSNQTSGFKNHTRGGSFNQGTITQHDHPYIIEHDRDIEFPIDRADVDETNYTASLENIARDFEERNAMPEYDARFFERVSEAAINTTGLSASKALNTYTKTTILGDIKNAIKKVKRYRGSLICYVRSELMDALEEALADKAHIEWTSISGLEFSIETRVAKIDGVPIMEVIDNERFCTKFDYTEGFTKSSVASSTQTDPAWKKLAGKDLNLVLASTKTVITVPKLSEIYFFTPGSDSRCASNYIYQHREYWDTFVFPNAKNDAIDSVYVEYDPGA